MNKKEIREWLIFENHGQKIFGVLHKPIGKSRVPAVVMCHGFGGNKTGRFRYYVILAEKLAEHGIASLRFDFRGSGDSEGSASEMTLNGLVEDAHKAIDTLHSVINPSCMGILGRSLGGAVAIKAASERNDIKSIALWVPLFSSQRWKEKWAQLRTTGLEENEKKELRYFHGQMPSKEFLLQFFSLDLSQDLKKIGHIPMLHAHCGKDSMINENHSQQYAASREQADAETKMLIYPHQDHDLCNTEELQQMIGDTVEWFTKTL